MAVIYLDHAATTPVLPEIAARVHDVMRNDFGNPSSVHRVGRSARGLVENARRQVAALIGADPEEIVFTSGGTESDNLALWGAVRAAGPGAHVVTSAVEHHAVLDTCRALEARGFRVTRVGVDAFGRVDPDDVIAAIRPDTAVISIMLANNEIGTIEPIAEIARGAREYGVLVHTDAVQAVGQLPVDVRKLGVDLLSCSGHKIYGPKGIGALYIRRGVRRRIEPLFHGGGQEGRMRPGTENVPAIVGFGLAAERAVADRSERSERETRWRDRLITGLLDRIPGARLNGHPAERLPNNVNLWIPGIDVESLLIQLDLEGIAASSGSACSAGSVESSHVLAAVGLSGDRAAQAVRLTVGRLNDDEQIEEALERIPRVVERVRSAERFVVRR